jgi:membrane-associated protease RseP (regulator of RpoE activity)
MQSWRRCSVALAAIAFAAGTRTAGDAPPPAAGPPARLPPVHVADSSLFFGYYLDVRWSTITGLIDDIVVTKVEAGSLAERAGLRAGDYLLAVDGNRATGITQTDLAALMARSYYPGDSVVYKFTVGRGFLMRRHEVILRFKG